MKLPQHSRARPTAYERQPSVARRGSGSEEVSPAACCAWVNIPLVGPKCVLELPVCP